MVILRVQVDCFSCRKPVDKAQARLIKAVNLDKRYECFKCFKRNKTTPWGMGDEIRQKRDLFCERCKYKFKARSSQCPYCNKMDHVTESNISVHDLL